jgi:hypothetical protein
VNDLVVLDHIDAIARREGRDKLWVWFDLTPRRGTWREDTLWLETTEWLSEHGFAWRRCFKIADETVMLGSYYGSLALETPHNPDGDEVRLLDSYFETSDAQPSVEGRVLNLLPLSEPMKNAHHDEPGFWEAWADRV